jgi:hypothetical protein
LRDDVAPALDVFFRIKDRQSSSQSGSLCKTL